MQHRVPSILGAVALLSGVAALSPQAAAADVDSFFMDLGAECSAEIAALTDEATGPIAFTNDCMYDRVTGSGWRRDFNAFASIGGTVNGTISGSAQTSAGTHSAAANANISGNGNGDGNAFSQATKRTTYHGHVIDFDFASAYGDFVVADGYAGVATSAGVP